MKIEAGRRIIIGNVPDDGFSGGIVFRSSLLTLCMGATNRPSKETNSYIRVANISFNAFSLYHFYIGDPFYDKIADVASKVNKIPAEQIDLELLQAVSPAFELDKFFPVFLRIMEGEYKRGCEDGKRELQNQFRKLLMC